MHITFHATRYARRSSGDKNNVPLINEILTLKLEMSKLLGFENYAEQVRMRVYGIFYVPPANSTQCLIHKTFSFTTHFSRLRASAVRWPTVCPPSTI